MSYFYPKSASGHKGKQQVRSSKLLPKASRCRKFLPLIAVLRLHPQRTDLFAKSFRILVDSRLGFLFGILRDQRHNIGQY